MGDAARRKQSAPHIGMAGGHGARETPQHPSVAAAAAASRRKYSEAAALAGHAPRSPSDDQSRAGSVSSAPAASAAQSPQARPRGRLARLLSIFLPASNSPHSPRSPSARAGSRTSDDMGFETVCPAVATSIPQARRPHPSPPQFTHSAASFDRMRLDLAEDEEQRTRKRAEEDAKRREDEARGEAKKGWIPPESWAVIGHTTYVSDAMRMSVARRALEEESFELVPPLPAGAPAPPAPADDAHPLWSLRVFRPVDAADVDALKAVAVGGHHSLAVAIPETMTAIELCVLLEHKFRSTRDLSKFRLYFVTHRTERLVDHGEMPVRMMRDSLMRIGYEATDPLPRMGRDDQSYCFRFVFRAYPLPPPGPDDFVAVEPGRLQPRITATVASLDGAHLSVVPTALFRLADTLEFLDLSRNTLLDLPSDLFARLKALRVVRLVGNLLRRVPPALLAAPSITHLDLSSNFLTGDELSVLDGLPALTHLNVSCNRVSSLPARLGGAESHRLRALDISSNYLTELPPCLWELTDLRDLNASFNRITHVPPAIAALELLRSLILVGNGINSVDACVTRLPSLSHLDLRGNLLTSIDVARAPEPDDECDSADVSDLSISMDSSLQTIVENGVVFTMPEVIPSEGEESARRPSARESPLLELYVDYNELAELPDSPRWPHLGLMSAAHNGIVAVSLGPHLRALRSLCLSSSRLVRLPDDIFEATPQLETLELQNNGLTRLPRSVSTLHRLTHLVAHSNALSELDVDGAGLRSLTHLVAHTNNIVGIGPGLWACPALRVLNVSSNFLAAMPDVPEDLGDEPPLATVLEEFLAADNRLRDDAVAMFFEVPLRALRVLNLSYNKIASLGDALAAVGPRLTELYLSGNTLTALPAGIEYCGSLRMLFVNGNRVTNLPGELAEAGALAVFDAQSNALKYNVANWPYDWNWNCSPGLEYLSLAHNRRLEIRAPPAAPPSPHAGASAAPAPAAGAMRTDFKAMHRLRALDLTDVQVAPQCLPQTATDLQIRVGGAASLGVGVSFGRAASSPALLSAMSPAADAQLPRLAFAEYCGRKVVFDQTEVVRRRFMGQEKDHIVGLFDGKGTDLVSAFLSDVLPEQLQAELHAVGDADDFATALRRAFLAANRELSLHPVDMLHRGSTACVLYIMDEAVYVANVGDTMAVMSREGIAHVLTTRHHAWARGEQARIRELGGYISLQGLVERELPLTRMFGHHQLLPFVNACPAVRYVPLEPTDEFVLLATDSFWAVMSYQMAVDVARKERGDPDLAVQKLRDMAIARGVTSTMKILLVDLRGIASCADGAAPHQHAAVERRRIAFRKRQQDFQDQVLSRLDDETPPPRPPCSFVFTDIKSSSKSWFAHYNAMRIANKMHAELIRRLLRVHGGYEMKNEGDAFVIAFQGPLAALRFCVAVQLAFLEHEHWPREILDVRDAMPVYGADGRLLYRGLSLRMGIHHGPADDEMDQVARRMDYHGVNLIIAHRVMDRADGGQINITDVVRAAVLDAPEAERPDVVFYDLGDLELKGVGQPVRVHAVYSRVLAERYVVSTGGDAVPRGGAIDVAPAADAGLIVRPDAALRSLRRADSLTPVTSPHVSSRLSVSVVPEDIADADHDPKAQL